MNPEVFPNPYKKGGFITNVTVVTINDKQYRRFRKCNSDGKSSDSHYYLHCLETQANVTCGYEIRSSSTMDCTHVCKFESRVQMTLHILFKSTRKKQGDGAIMEAYSRFVSKTGISFTAATSPEFFDLMHLIITKAIETPRDLVSPEMLFPRISDKQLRKTMSNIAHDAFNTFLGSLKNSVVEITLDSGTVYMIHFVIVCCTDVINAKSPRVIRLHVSDGSLDAAGYASIGKEIIDFLHEKEIHVNSFTTDGLRAQLNAFTHSHPCSIASTNNEDEKYRLFIHNRCACHLTELALRKAINENEYFKRLIESMMELVTELRKVGNRKKLAKHCPTISQTRWSHLQIISNWIGSHIKEISQIVDATYLGLLGQMNMICAILEPFKGLISAFEMDLSRITDVFPLVVDAIVYLQELKKADPRFTDDNWENIIDCLIRNLQQYTILSDYGELYALAYALTPYGREALILKKLCSMDSKKYLNHRPHLHQLIRFSNRILEQYEFTFTSDSMDETDNQLSESEEPNIIEQMTNSDEFLEQSSEDSESISESQVFYDTLINESQGDVEEMSQNINDIDWFRVSYEKLIKLSEQFGFDEEQKLSLINGFTSWCTPSTRIPFHEILQSGAIAYWRCVNRAQTSFDILSHVAIRIITVLTSEASCERSISEIRRIVGQRRARLTPEMIFNLLILAQK